MRAGRRKSGALFAGHAALATAALAQDPGDPILMTTAALKRLVEP